jgi:hypothetical protein
MKYTLLLIAFCFTTLGLQAQWETVEGPKQWNLEKFVYAEGVLYGYSNHGIYKSTDEGYNWMLDRKVLNNSGLFVAEYVTNGSDHYLNPGTGVSITRIEPNGRVVNIPLDIRSLEGESVRNIAVFGGIIYAFVGQRTLYSTDRGETWQSIVNPMFEPYSFALFKGAMYVSGKDQLYRSGDMGQTWAMVRQFDGAYGVQLTAVNDFLYANAAFVNVYRSSDGFITDSQETNIFGEVDYNTLFAYHQNGLFSMVKRDVCAGFSVKVLTGRSIVGYKANICWLLPEEDCSTAPMGDGHLAPTW